MDYYNVSAGVDVKAMDDFEKYKLLDQYGNPSGNEYDLGKDDAFTKYKILVGLFWNDPKQVEFNIDIFKYAVATFVAVGFNIYKGEVLRLP